MADTINVLVVDDQTLLSQALENLLAQNADLNVVGTASDGHEAIKQVALHRPDVVLLDIEMPNMNGLNATQLITQRFPETKVILLSAHDDDAYLINALKVGAKAYLLKDTLSHDLTETIRNVHKGYGQFGPGILEKMVAGMDANGKRPSQAATEEASPPSKTLETLPSEVPQYPVQIAAGAGTQQTLSESDLTLALSRFEPKELTSLVEQLRSQPETARTLKPFFEQRLEREPGSLAELYLLGALHRQIWDQPKTAIKFLKQGFQSGIRQEIAPETLLLLYREALPIDPTVAFGWLTQVGSPWNAQKHLPFLIHEAAAQLGRESRQYRVLLMLYRIRALKAMLLKPPDVPAVASRNSHHRANVSPR